MITYAAMYDVRMNVSTVVPTYLYTTIGLTDVFMASGRLYDVP